MMRVLRNRASLLCGGCFAKRLMWRNCRGFAGRCIELRARFGIGGGLRFRRNSIRFGVASRLCLGSSGDSRLARPLRCRALADLGGGC